MAAELQQLTAYMDSVMTIKIFSASTPPPSLSDELINLYIAQGNGLSCINRGPTILWDVRFTGKQKSIRDGLLRTFNASDEGEIQLLLNVTRPLQEEYRKRLLSLFEQYIRDCLAESDTRVSDLHEATQNFVRILLMRAIFLTKD